jgi:hypothetical protein
MESEITITTENVERLLCARYLEAAMRNGNHWEMRANGQKKTWKTRPRDFRLPFKVGLKTCGAITQDDFDENGILKPGFYRVKQGLCAGSKEHARKIAAGA